MKADSGDKAEVERLEKQVEHYKEVLAQTVSRQYSNCNEKLARPQP